MSVCDTATTAPTTMVNAAMAATPICQSQRDEATPT